MSLPPAASRSGLFASLRSRVVAIALVPSLVFICAVVGVGWYQSDRMLQERANAELVGDGVDATVAFTGAVMDERRISVQGGGDLSAARTATDKAAASVRAFANRVPDTAPDGVRSSFAGLAMAVESVSRARRDVDSGARDRDAYAAYEPVVEPLTTVVGTTTAPASDIDVVTAMGSTGQLLAAVESIRGADLVVATGGSRGLDKTGYRELAAEAGQIGEAMQNAVAALPAARRDAGTALLDSPEWRTFTADTELLLAAGPVADAPATGGQGESQRGGAAAADRASADRAAATAATAAELPGAGDAAAAKATDIAFGTAHDGVALAVARATTALDVIVGVVLGVVAIVVVGMLLAMRTGNRLGRRMAGLRAATHGTSARLPEVLDRIRRGDLVDVAAEFPAVDHGSDEIGEVGAAVETAQRSAVAAAAEEARTRAGANAVFLNIAHRSQAIVHRQLQVLDEAERAENDSDQLARLFQLDHLSTRERRNAENLIIMGGQQPRRRWRKPVPLAEIIRSAVSESEQYTRITLGETPHRYVDGAAVGDLIHLLAELVDNATSFSPPQCPIDISASVVGRGVAIEIEDRGLGVEPEPRARLNEMLAAPPDFGLLTLSEDSRLGLFVVSRLAQRHGVRVTLLESTYGGVQALVLVPNAVLVSEPSDDGQDVEPDAEREPGVRGGPTPGSSTNGVAPQLPERNGRRPRDNGRPAGGKGPNGPSAEPEALPRQRSAAPPARPTGTTKAATAREPKPALPERVSGATPVVDRRADAPVDAPTAGIADPAADERPAAVRPADEMVVTTAVDDRSGAGLPPEVAAEATAEVGRPATAEVDEAPAVPALPERRPQGHLAKGLRGRPGSEQAAAGADPAVEPSADRSSSAMSAMQRGVRNSRREATEEGGRP